MLRLWHRYLNFFFSTYVITLSSCKRCFMRYSYHLKCYLVLLQLFVCNLRSFAGMKPVSTIMRHTRLPGYALRFAESGGSISIFGISYWKILCSKCLQYKVHAPECDPGACTFTCCLNISLGLHIVGYFS
jgi:hypothetical protein